MFSNRTSRNIITQKGVDKSEYLRCTTDSKNRTSDSNSPSSQPPQFFEDEEETNDFAEKRSERALLRGGQHFGKVHRSFDDMD